MWKPIARHALTWGALALALVGTSPQAEAIEISVTPEQPTPYEALTVLLEGDPIPLAVGSVRREGFQLIIDMAPTCGPIICVPPPPLLEEVAFEPTLQAGIFEIRVEDNGILLASQEVDVRGYFLQPRLAFDPPEPNDNETVQAVVSLLSWQGVELTEIERQGSVLDLHVHIPFPNILPPSPEPDATVLDLGALEAGDYTVRLHTLDPGGEMRRVWIETLSVLDADDRAILQDRFHVTVNWQDFVGNEGVGRPVPGASDDSTLFSFFQRSNWELMVKVLDGCQLNNHYWVLTGGATNLAFDIQIEDPITGNSWSVSNPLGQTATAVTDTLALPCE